MMLFAIRMVYIIDLLLILTCCALFLFMILESQRVIEAKIIPFRERPIYRLFTYFMEHNLCNERLTDDEIETLIRKRTWNPRWTKPHFPWNKDHIPVALYDGRSNFTQKLV